MKIKEWNKIADKYMSVPYKFGSWDINKGLDCLSFICLMMEEQGHSVDYYQEYDGIGLLNYTDIDDHDLLMDNMITFIRANSKEVEKINYHPGQIVIYQTGQIQSVGILDLNANIIICSINGVKHISKVRILEVRKWC